MPAQLEPAGIRVDDVDDDSRWSAIQLDGASLAGIDARGVDLDEARVSDSDLSGARVLRLGLLDSEFVRCNLANLDGRDSSMLRTVFAESRMTGFAWPEGTVQDVLFRDCRADMASFRFAKLKRVTFEGCVLREADFSDARLESVRFHDCDLTGAGFRGARFESSEFRSCRLDDLRGVESLRGVAMEWTDILALAGPFAAAVGVRLLDEDD